MRVYTESQEEQLEAVSQSQRPHCSTNPTEKSDGEAERKVGFEIVCSAILPSNFFKNRNAVSYALRDDRWTRCLRRALQ
jgi:hypothetical protein